MNNKILLTKIMIKGYYEHRNYLTITKLLFCIFTCVTLVSCDKFLEVDVPLSKIQNDIVFSDDATATSAAIGMYIDLYNQGSFASGNDKGLAASAGLSADELRYVPANSRDYLDFQENDINAQNRTVLEIWNSMYRTIYSANAILEGLDRSNSVSDKIRNRIKGEAMFVRAFSYFYLTNLFGEVPIVLNTDYRLNSQLSRNSIESVYQQILKDLTSAEGLLSEDYEGGDRARPNKFSVTAMLARVYLYMENWQAAEDKATNVINNSQRYGLVNLNNVFLPNSQEAIWQLKPSTGEITKEAYFFSVVIGTKYNSLNSSVLSAFESADMRKTAWITSTNFQGTTIYFPYKYKKSDIGPLPDEYSMVIRLAELYLIRAEARAHLNKLTDAVSDLDKIRQRAGLSLIRDRNPAITPEGLYTVIEHERRIELLTEWGHRWFDLKRTKRINSVLSGIKTGWAPDDALYPVPESELSKNTKLRPQNPGY